MRAEMKRWAVTRHAFGRPYRVHLAPAAKLQLEKQYLDFVRTPKQRSEIEAMLAEKTDCPAELIQALRMTLYTELFLGARTGRGGRLVDLMGGSNGEPRVEYLTALGAVWLESVMGEQEEI